MDTSLAYPSDVAFSPTVKEIQALRGSRRTYAKLEESGSWSTTITPELAGFIAEQRSVFLATANGAGQPYILADNPRAHLFLIDYVNLQRVKIWGTTRAVEATTELVSKLMPQGYKARPEQVLLFTVAAWDANCSQHIPRRYESAEVEKALEESSARIAALEAEVARLKALVA
jgi:hypothetical protein